MSINVAHTRVTINDATGAITLFFGDESTTFDTWEDLKAYGAGVVSDDIAKRIIAAKIVENSPDGANKSNQVGAQVSINPQAAVPVVYTPPIE